MKHVFFGLCVLGGVILAVCIGWWSFNRGELIEEIRLIESGKAHSGPLDAAPPQPDKDDALGPYTLTPDDNPLQVAVSGDDSALGQRGRLPRARVYVKMYDHSGSEIWSGAHLLAYGDHRDYEGRGARPVTELARAKPDIFMPITVTKTGKYTFRCGFETLPEDAADKSFDIILTIRKNAEPFPAGWAVTGFGLIVLGAVLLQASGGESDIDRPASADAAPDKKPDGARATSSGPRAPTRRPIRSPMAPSRGPRKNRTAPSRSPRKNRTAPSRSPRKNRTAPSRSPRKNREAASRSPRKKREAARRNLPRSRPPSERRRVVAQRRGNNLTSPRPLSSIERKPR